MRSGHIRLMGGGWRTWIVTSPSALRVGRAVAVVAAIGLCVAVGLAVATLIRGRPVSGVDYLLFPAVPAVAGGQLWGLATLRARHPRWFWPRDPRELFFAGLPIRVGNALLAVCALCWVAGMTTIPSLMSGSPTSPARDCRYRLDDKGTYRCVSRARYLHAGAAEQRFAASILGAFFAVHLGMATAELARRRARRR